MISSFEVFEVYELSTFLSPHIVEFMYKLNRKLSRKEGAFVLKSVQN